MNYGARTAAAAQLTCKMGPGGGGACVNSGQQYGKCCEASLLLLLLFRFTHLRSFPPSPSARETVRPPSLLLAPTPPCFVSISPSNTTLMSPETLRVRTLNPKKENVRHYPILGTKKGKERMMPFSRFFGIFEKVFLISNSHGESRDLFGRCNLWRALDAERRENKESFVSGLMGVHCTEQY